MRDFLSWFSAAAVAFFVTAGAFLLLANLASDTNEAQRISRPQPSSGGPTLKMDLQADGLDALERAPGQRLEVVVSNTGDRPVSDLNATVKVSSEDTALVRTRFYRAAVTKLRADETKTVGFEVDLSPFEDPAGGAPVGLLEPPRTIVEVRATTPRGASAVKTAVLPAS